MSFHAATRVRGFAALGLIALLVSACSAGATATPTLAPLPTAAPGSPAASAPATGAVVVGTASTSLGTVLVGPNGLTLYTRSSDSTNTSSCTGGCISAWPALVVPAGGTASAGTGVTGAVGTFVRTDDSTTQVTYKGLPLYYWKGDTKPGDVTGQGVASFSVAKP